MISYEEAGRLIDALDEIAKEYNSKEWDGAQYGLPVNRKATEQMVRAIQEWAVEFIKNRESLT